MLTYNLTKTEGMPIYEYICKCIKKDISEGILKSGEKLPSKRVFAENMGVSVITVENAYAQLVAEGYIYSIPQKGFFVSDVANVIADKTQIDYSRNEKGKQKKIEYFADFSSNQTSSELFPFTIWSKVIREVLSDSRIQLMTNSPCKGIYELRENIADYLREFRGMNVDPEQIVVGAGTEYLYGLIIQLLGFDKVYAVENPGYRKVENITESLGAKVELLTMDKHGVKIEDIRKKKVDIVHVTPAHQFPTGVMMNLERRMDLLKWVAEDEKRYVIEDDFDSELHLSGRPLPTLQSMDATDSVIYMNTFTRTLCSTARISYMILPNRLVKEFEERMSFYSCTVSNFEQYTLSKFIENGKFESHVNRLRSFYKRKRDLLLEAIGKCGLADIAELSGTEAGLHFVMKIKTRLPEEKLLENAKKKGIKLVPLSKFYSEGNFEKNIYVMSYSSVDVVNADEIMERIKQSCV